MNILMVLKIAAALLTILAGLLALIRPTAIYGFTGLKANGARGLSEIRSIFGGLFIGLGLTPFFLGEAAYQTLGVGYLAIAVVRAFSILFDNSRARSNTISLITEIILGAILVL